MRLTEFRKYITWNIASLSGYIGIFIMFVFLLMLMIASSGTTIRADINEIFHDYIVKHILMPYLKFYRFQLFWVLIFILFSVVEHRYYVMSEHFGARLFENHEKAYSYAFALGLSLNFIPLNIIFIISILVITRII